MNGITVDGVHGTVLDGVSVSGAKLDGIRVQARRDRDQELRRRHAREPDR